MDVDLFTLTGGNYWKWKKTPIYINYFKQVTISQPALYQCEEDKTIQMCGMYRDNSCGPNYSELSCHQVTHVCHIVALNFCLASLCHWIQEVATAKHLHVYSIFWKCTMSKKWRAYIWYIYIYYIHNLGL